MKVKTFAATFVLFAVFQAVQPNIAEDLGDVDAGSSAGENYSMSMDFDSSGQFDIGDITGLLYWMYRGGAAPDCSDAMDYNLNGRINIIDAVSGLRYLFMHTNSVPAMGAGCQAYAGCEPADACHE